MNKNMIFYGIIGFLLIIVAFLLWHILWNTWDNFSEKITKQTQIDIDIPFPWYNKAMDEHCVFMPEMRGCEPYNNLRNNTPSEDTQEEIVNVADTQLPLAQEVEVVELQDWDTYDLEVGLVRKEIGNDMVVMLAYNGSVPGPILKAPEWAKVTLNFKNTVPDLETTLHSHGLRQDYTMDGVPKDMMGTQDPVWFWESFTYEIEFPDTGVFWYHPHIREDLQQELGLSGNYIVTPKKQNYWNPVNREETLILDDILLENGKIAPISTEFANYILMGRFWNTMLINGETDYTISTQKGEVIRLNLTNVSNTRVYNFEIPWVKIKRVGWDIWKYEREEFVESIVIAPAERYIVEVYFPESWEFEIQNNTPVSQYTLWKIIVSDESVSESFVSDFQTLKQNDEIMADIDSYRGYFEKEIDKEIELDMTMWGMDMSGMMMHGDSHDGIEWEDEMGRMNEIHTSDHVTWNIIDRQTGKENMEIDWNFSVWDVVKVRIYNKEDGMHPMQHPIHFHGQRFLVLSQNGVENTNLVWKDTALIKTGEYIDILIDMSNPGEWMAHCHIAEHLSAGMMMHFSVK